MKKKLTNFLERIVASCFKCEKSESCQNTVKKKRCLVCAVNVLLAGGDHLYLDREMRSVIFPLSDV